MIASDKWDPETRKELNAIYEEIELLSLINGGPSFIDQDTSNAGKRNEQIRHNG